MAGIPTFHSYSDAYKFWRRGRENTTYGRKLGGSSFDIHKDPYSDRLFVASRYYSGYVWGVEKSRTVNILRSGDVIFYISPDDTVEFVATSDKVRRINGAVGLMVERVFSGRLLFDRVATGEYEVHTNPNAHGIPMPAYPSFISRYTVVADRASLWNEWYIELHKWRRSISTSWYYPGLKVNMRDGMILNPREKPVPKVDEDRRKWWLGQLRLLRKNFHGKAKMGIGKPVQGEGWTHRTEDERFKDAVEAVETGVATNQFVDDVVRHHSGHYFYYAETERYERRAMSAYGAFLAANSKKLREHFGVIEEVSE